MSQFCPRCGAARLGADAFCSKCGFQFAEVEPIKPTGRPMTSRLSGRRAIATVVVVLLGLGVIGNLGKPASPTTAQLPSATPAAVAATTTKPTPWATVKPAIAPTGDLEEATVVRIVDGDTIVVALGGKNVKVRYIGMDTPEDVDPNSPVEPMSREAAAANETLVGGKTVYLERDVSETDRYDRLLRYVWLKDGATWTLVNLELVRLGLAKAISYPPDTRLDAVLAAAEGSAQQTLVGLWAAAPSPTVAATPKPTPRPTPRPTKKPSSCHPSYIPCLPIVGDLDCSDVRAMGKAPVEVVGPDDYRLDRDGDGLGCE